MSTFIPLALLYPFASARAFSLFVMLLVFILAPKRQVVIEELVVTEPASCPARGA